MMLFDHLQTRPQHSQRHGKRCQADRSQRHSYGSINGNSSTLCVDCDESALLRRVDAFNQSNSTFASSPSDEQKALSKGVPSSAVAPAVFEIDPSVARGGVACPFPWKLHIMLDVVEREGRHRIVSWQVHGRSFAVHQPRAFVEKVLKR